MLIKRTEENGVIKALYESSNIVASTYVTNDNKLSIVFKTGQEYIYDAVPAKDYHMFELAESQGKVFNKFIRQYNFEKGDTVDVQLLREQLEQVKIEELKGLENEIADKALAVSDYHKTTTQIDMNQLKALSSLINTYIDQKEN